MDGDPSFVSLRQLFVDYSRQRRWWVGSHTSTYSVLRDVSAQINQGAWLTVFGKEGAGKTTLLRVLAGIIRPTHGSVLVNSHSPGEIPGLAAGYVSAEESEPLGETVNDVLYSFGTTHRVTSLPARIGEITEILGLKSVLARPARTLSTAERLRLNVARAALSDSPLVLLDDTADELGVDQVGQLLPLLFQGRTVIIATRFVPTAEALNLPILLLHNATLAHTGTCDEIANSLACPRILDVWIEGLRYDLLRKLRHHSGVIEVRLLPSSRFSGQRLRITLQSARYLPSLYDMISQAPLVKVQEIPASLTDILARL